MFKYLFVSLFFFLILSQSQAQLVINEASNRNYLQVKDEDGDYNDWIELYNTGSSSIALDNWSLSDNRDNPEKWSLAGNSLSAHGFLLVHASGKDRNPMNNTSLNWSGIILSGDEFKYIIPGETVPNNWIEANFDDTSWDTGISGFGYGDGDDATVVPEQTTVLLLRKFFTIADTSNITAASLFIDYDDGFVAYLNGIEIARSNVNGTPNWNTLANSNHEALKNDDAVPEEFEIDFSNVTFNEGENVLAIAAVNVERSSSDLTMIPYLLLGTENASSQYRPLPEWYGGQSGIGNLHANFKLKSKGEKIFLSENGTIIDSLDVDGLWRDMSVGRVTDGSNEYGLFIEATPGKTNNSSQAYTEGYTEQPKLDLVSGFYSSAIEVNATVFDEAAEIHYSFDGKEPTINSPKYNGPIKISSTRCIRFRAFKTGYLPSKITTATYFIDEEDATLPVLSVIADPNNIFGSDGIFTNWRESFDIPAYMEYFNKDNDLEISQNAGMQMDGGAGGSRSKDQHSFRIEPGNGALGDGDLKYKLLHRRPYRENYPSFYVRNGSNQHLILPYKDGLEVKAMGQNTYNYYSAYEPIMVYINGDFFGVYELREKINDDFLVDNYQMNIDSLDFLGVSFFKGKQLEALRGSIEPFLADYEHFLTLNPDSGNYLENVGQFLDLKNYTDYIIAESWIGNNDWPTNNIKVFRCKGTNYKWQWAINDLEWSLKPHEWSTSSFDHINYMLGHETSVPYTGFWYNLVKNEKYLNYFVNRFADLMNTNYLFSTIGPLEDEMYEELNAEMDHQYERWGTSNISSQMSTFRSNHGIFRSELQKRSNYVRDDLRTHFHLRREVDVTLDVEPEGAGSITISTITPNNYPWEGIYFGEVEVAVKANPNPGYEFVNWDSDAFIADVWSDSIVGVFEEGEAILKANFQKTEYTNGGIAISEINYKSADDRKLPDWIELCNFSNESVSLKNWYFTDADTSHLFTFSYNVSLGRNERIVICNDLDRFYKSYPGIAVYDQEFDFGLGTPSDKILLYNDKDSLICKVEYSDTFPWPLNNDFTGRTLELRSPGGNLNESSSWFRGCIGGSPGSEFQQCDEEEFVQVPEISTSLVNLSVYPNPVNEQLNIDLYVDNDNTECSLKIYNTLSVAIYSENMGVLKAGHYHYTVNLGELPQQLLLLKITTGNVTELKRILKVN